MSNKLSSIGLQVGISEIMMILRALRTESARCIMYGLEDGVERSSRIDDLMTQLTDQLPAIIKSFKTDNFYEIVEKIKTADSFLVGIEGGSWSKKGVPYVEITSGGVTEKVAITRDEWDYGSDKVEQVHDFLVQIADVACDSKFEANPENSLYGFK